jgi:hypothetical protein
MITRDHFALNYSGYDPSLPPPLGFTVPPKNRALPTHGRIYRSGFVPIQAKAPHLMMDPTDPSTWQRPVRFT